MLSGMSKYIGSALPMSEAVVGLLGSVVSFGVITVLFAAIFKFLPDAKVSWRYVWIGAAVTALLFEIGKALLAIYLGRQGAQSPYGAATSVVLVLLWVYYASLILFFGAEFTQVYARAHGAKIEPAENAQPVATAKPPKEPLNMNQPASSDYTSTSASSSNGTPTPGPRKESARLAVGPDPMELNDHAPNPFIEKNALPLLIGAIGAGLLGGLLLRRGEVGAALTPGLQVKTSSRTLALGLAALAAGALSRWSKVARKELQPAKLRKQGRDILRKAQDGIESAVAHVR
jgi:hypothetical protein